MSDSNFGLLGTLIERIIQRVAELPDRTSPDDWPEAMMVTPAELRVIVAEEFEAGALPPAPPQAQEESGDELQRLSQRIARAVKLKPYGPEAQQIYRVLLAASPPAQEQEQGDSVSAIEGQWAMAAVNYARSQIVPNYGPDEAGTTYERGLVNRMAATYRDGWLAACAAMRALPPAPPQEQERTCGCVIADGGFLVQRVEGCTLEHVPDHEHRAASPPAQEQAADWEGADQIEEDMQESQRSAHRFCFGDDE